MAGKPPEDCKTMTDVRAEIDRLDAALVPLLAERFSYIQRASELKSTPEDARVEWRVQQVLDKVAGHAESAGLPLDLAETVWRNMIEWSIQYEKVELVARVASTDTKDERQE